MKENNQKIFKMVKKIPRLIFTKVAGFPPITGPDLDRYNAALDVLDPNCESYMEILTQAEDDSPPSDVIDLRQLMRKMDQALFFEFLDVLEEMRDHIVEKVTQAQQEPLAEEENNDGNLDAADEINGAETDAEGGG